MSYLTPRRRRRPALRRARRHGLPLRRRRPQLGRRAAADRPPRGRPRRARRCSGRSPSWAGWIDREHARLARRRSGTRSPSRGACGRAVAEHPHVAAARRHRPRHRRERSARSSASSPASRASARSSSTRRCRCSARSRSSACMPLLIVWLGIGEGVKVGLVVIGVIFPIYLNLHKGIRGVDPRFAELSKACGVGRWGGINAPGAWSRARCALVPRRPALLALRRSPGSRWSSPRRSTPTRAWGT